MIAVIAGSTSDLVVIEVAKPYFAFFDIPHEIRVLSAHRQHDELVEYVRTLEQKGCRCIIACAGMAAHLPGIIAALTDLPVIGVPLDASSLQGIDALLSIVQMPKGIPVATMTIGKAGLINAVVYAARILALSDDRIKTRFAEFKKRGCKL